MVLNRRILYIGSKRTPYLYEMKKQFKNLFHIDIIDILDYQADNYVEKVVYRIKYIRTIYNILYLIISLNKRYEIIHIHGCRPINKFFYWFIRSHKSKMILTIWGSDYLQADSKQKRNLSNYFSIARYVTCTNIELMNSLVKEYQILTDKVFCINYFFSAIEYMKQGITTKEINDFKHKYGIPKDKRIICCGTNSSPNQQHQKIISELNEIDDDDLFFIFPFTYGSIEYKKEIKRLLRRTKLNYLFFDNFLSDYEIAVFRILVDVLIQLQKTDQLSGAMLEAAFGGSYVVTGQWLPYGVLDKEGLKYTRINKFSELAEGISTALKCDKASLSNNKIVIDSITNADTIREEWRSLYNGS